LVWGLRFPRCLDHLMSIPIVIECCELTSVTSLIVFASTTFLLVMLRAEVTLLKPSLDRLMVLPLMRLLVPLKLTSRGKPPLRVLFEKMLWSALPVIGKVGKGVQHPMISLLVYLDLAIADPETVTSIQDHYH